MMETDAQPRDDLIEDFSDHEGPGVQASDQVPPAAEDASAKQDSDDPFAEFKNINDEELLLNDDGTLTGGPVLADVAEVNDASEDEAATLGEEPLPEEPWKDRPPAERELWERVRPRALRREALRTRDCKFPTATLNRLMRMHPDMHTKTSEAVDVVNYATVLLLQNIAQAVARGRKGSTQTVRLEDLKEVCKNNRELHFLMPLSATFDASALSISHHDADEKDGANSKASSRLQAAPPGQSTLSSSIFARTAAPAKTVEEVAKEDGAPEEAAEQLDVVTVQGNLELRDKTPQQKSGSKRKTAPSAKKDKATSKAPRQEKESKAVKPPAGPGIASFFKKAETN